MKKISGKQIITLLITILMVSVNALANILPINGLLTGDISDRFDILFVPAGYVFSIWGLIYLGLIIFTIFQLLPSKKENLLLNKITIAYWISSLANTAWIFFWHYEIFSLTLPMMIIILFSLIYIFNKLSNKELSLSNTEKWFVKVPFSIYLGWISVATIANVTQVLHFFEWSGLGINDNIWAIIMLIVGTILGTIMLLLENNIYFVLVVVWAFIGIGVAQVDTLIVANTAYISTGILIIEILLITFVKNLKSKKDVKK